MSQSMANENVSNPVTLSYGSDNYSSWREQMMRHVDGHGLSGFIDGTLQPPPHRPDVTTDPGIHNMWRADKQLRLWILSTISEHELFLNAAKLNTARKVCLYLEAIFQNRDDTRSTDPQNVHNASFNVRMTLAQAAVSGNWEELRRVWETHPDEANAYLHRDDDVLKIAVGTGKAFPFVENLLRLLPDESIAITDGHTALHVAAAAGNVPAAEMLVSRMPALCYTVDNDGNFPVQTAAQFAQREMLVYLISVTRDDVIPNPFASTSGLSLLILAINAEFFDIAIDLVTKYPSLATEGSRSGNTAFAHLARNSVLSNKKNFGFWERLLSSLCRKLNVLQQKNLEQLVPHIRTIKEKSRAKVEALELVRLLCNTIKKDLEVSVQQESTIIFKKGLVIAAFCGARDVVDAVTDVYPTSYMLIGTQRPHPSIFHVAISRRSEDVFNLIYQMSNYKHIITNLTDDNGNNMLHLAGKLAPSSKLSEISGAALQMQREVQWFEEVKKLVPPNVRENLNNDQKTPKMVFIEEHKSLKEAGEKWMKETANYSTISAALIATVMFAAAITVPGGNDGSNGYPLFSNNPAFIVFAVSDAISLYASVTSLLLFLAILTSRYAEEDFLKVLPQRLIFGLGTLFLSITFMTVAFGATVFLVFGKQRLWVILPVLVLSCFPVASFVLVQFPLMFELISSTYGSGLFGKKSDRPYP